MYRGKEEQGRVPEAKWDRGTASSNQIVLLIGDTATGGAGLSETPVIVSSSQTSDLRDRKRTRWAFLPCYLISICSDISSRHVRHFTTPFPSTHKCRSHLTGFKAEGDQYLFSQRQWELKERTAVRLLQNDLLASPVNTVLHLSLIIFVYFWSKCDFKSPGRARQAPRRPWELTFGYARARHFHTKTSL